MTTPLLENHRRVAPLSTLHDVTFILMLPQRSHTTLGTIVRDRTRRAEQVDTAVPSRREHASEGNI